MMERPPIIQTEPTLETEVEGGLETADHEWLILTEAIKQEAARSPEVRHVLMEAAQKPVSEDLPRMTLNGLREVNTRIANLANRYHGTLGNTLARPELPTEKIVPDLREAPITAKERATANSRFRYARDIKLMALMSILIETPLQACERTADGEYQIPPGIRLFAEGQNAEETKALMDPLNWEARLQLKDRVFQVTVGGKTYILKEQKTRFHLHTMEGGHKPTASSQEEFRIAKDLHENATLTLSRITATWEKPLGYAEFPDGYQFAIFEMNPHLSEADSGEHVGGQDDKVFLALTNLILKHRTAFEAEYEEVAAAAETRYLHEEGIEYYEAPFKDKLLLRTVKLIDKPELRPVKMPFKDFALIKALRMKEQAIELMRNIEWKRGYVNQDHDAYGLYVSEENGPKLTIVGFDFEYLKKTENLPQDVEEFIESLKRSLREEAETARLQHDNFLLRILNKSASRIQAAAYRALLAREGLN